MDKEKKKERKMAGANPERSPIGDGRDGVVIRVPVGDGPALEVENTYEDEIFGPCGSGIRVYNCGYGTYGVYVEAADNESGAGVLASANGWYSAGVRASALGEVSAAVRAHASGGGSEGVSASGEFIGVSAYVRDPYSYGVYAHARGDDSEGVHAYSEKFTAIVADTGRPDHNWGFYTNDNIYVGGKIDLIGAIDPIIVERFNADPAVADYEVGDVVCLDEGSPYVKICDKADDTKVVGVVGPKLELKDGEISVVIMGYRGAKPDTEHVKALEERLEKAEPRMAEFVKSKARAEMVKVEKEEENKSLENEITMLKSGIKKEKSTTRLVVKIKVDANSAPIKRGDLLTSSTTKGHAMKAKPVEISGVEIHRPGTIIGKAMEPLESGTGLIEVFVALQ